ncbi:zona pellucida-binding protein 2-like [Anolis sagrei]|uniref:zona pellucida-binding protein 2-like n=1 Tax=Anolis sagrei TaxID=38937 RepID=UPI00352036C8
MERITDPKYLWMGPLGYITKGSKKFILSDDGNLEIYSIKSSDSGRYTCKVSYLYNSTQLTTEIHFMVYVYHIPDKSIHLSSEFTAESCKTNKIDSYEKHLLEKMESLISNLSCEIKEWSTECHTSTDAVEKMTYKLTLQFGVFPSMLTTADLCRSPPCENSTSNLRKAYENIKEFFELQKTDSPHIDELYLIPGTLAAVKVDHCKPGFGKNTNSRKNNSMCPGCCVTCPPGRFSAKQDTVCILCPVGSYNEKYGQVECENCPEAKSSDGKGAKTKRKCHMIRKLKLVQNAVARLLTGMPSRCHITPILQQLHWLPIEYRITFKVLLKPEPSESYLLFGKPVKPFFSDNLSMDE